MFDIADPKHADMARLLYKQSSETFSRMFTCITDRVSEDAAILKQFGLDPKDCESFLESSIQTLVACIIYNTAHLTSRSVEATLEMLKYKCAKLDLDEITVKIER